MEDLISSIFSQPMEQIIKSLSAKFNLPESTVRSGIGIVLRFLKEKSDGTRFATLLDRIPGAEDAMKTPPAEEGSGDGGLLGGLMAKAGGLLGGDLGGAAAAMGALQKAGIPLDKAEPMAGEFLEQAKALAGPEVIDGLLEQIPALKSLLGDAK